MAGGQLLTLGQTSSPVPSTQPRIHSSNNTELNLYKVINLDRQKRLRMCEIMKKFSPREKFPTNFYPAIFSQLLGRSDCLFTNLSLVRPILETITAQNWKTQLKKYAFYYNCSKSVIIQHVVVDLRVNLIVKAFLSIAD